MPRRRPPNHLAFLEAELRRTCLGFPGAAEERAWGNPCFKVKGKIFCTMAPAGDHLLVTTKLTREEQGLLLNAPLVKPAAYVGRHGWIDIRLRARKDLNKTKAWIERSFELAHV